MRICAKISIFLRLQQFLNIVNVTAQINVGCIVNGARKASRAGRLIIYGTVRHKGTKFYPNVQVTKRITPRTHVTEWRNTELRVVGLTPRPLYVQAGKRFPVPTEHEARWVGVDALETRKISRSPGGSQVSIPLVHFVDPSLQ
jgi:hypothetical protein